MRRQIPLDLIHRLQISLRAESNLKFPSHSDPANLPSLEEFIADFDSDDGGARCGDCKGRLLRGSESMICVYCGRGQGDARELKPGRIGFNGTVGFRWLLESLGLDGSEMVAPTVDDNQNNARKNSRNGEVPLSELLNFQIEWPDDTGRFGVALENEVEVPGKKLLHLAGVELSGPFPGSTSTSSASTEQALPRDTFTPIESAVLHRQGNFGLSKNEQPTEASKKLDTVEEADSFSGWEADFQSARSDPQRLDVKSSESSLAHVVDYGSHIISAYENSEAAIEGSAADASASHASGNNWISNEHWGNPIGETLSGKSEVMTAHKEDTTFSQPESTSSASVEWFENQQKTSSIKVPASGKLVGEELDGGRKGSNDAEDNQWGTVDALIPVNVKQSVYDGSLDDWDGFAGSSAALGNPGQESSLQGAGNDPLDAWDGFTSSSRPQDNQLSSRTKDGTGNLGDYSDDGWNSFTSFASTLENQQAVLHDQIQFDPLGLEVHQFVSPAQPDYFQASTSKSAADDEPVKDELPFDLWNALQSSSHKQDTEEKNNHIEVADNKMGGVQNLADDWGDFMNLGKLDAMNSMSLFENKGDGDEVEPFDAWNEFAISTNGNDKATAEDSKSGTWGNALISDSVHLKNGEQTSESKISIEGDDMFDSWGDFRSSSNVVENSLARSYSSFDNGKVSEDIFSSSVPPYAMQNSDLQASVPNHDDPLNEWSNFGSLAHVSDKVSPVSGSIGSDSKITGEGDNMFDWVVQRTAETSDEQLKNDGAAAGQDTSEDLDTDDAWTDFTSSKVAEGDHDLGSTNVYNDRETINGSDPFDSWNMFVSSSSRTDDLTQFPTTHLVSAIRNSHDINSISSQPDLFPGAFNNLNGITKSGVPLAEDPSWFWTKNENAEAESKTKEIPTSQGSGKVSVSKSNDVESLISQMHDLSFMLESSLSIPKR